MIDDDNTPHGPESEMATAIPPCPKCGSPMVAWPHADGPIQQRLQCSAVACSITRPLDWRGDETAPVAEGMSEDKRAVLPLDEKQEARYRHLCKWGTKKLAGQSRTLTNLNVQSIFATLDRDRATIDAIRAERDALADKLSALPMTEDGVRVVPGMKLYYVHQRTDKVVVDEMFVNNNLNLSSTKSEPPAKFCWYADREAALAARDAGKAVKDKSEL